MAGFWSHGATLTVDSVKVNGVVDISLPNETRGVVETTDHDSAGDREFVAGLRDSGEVTLAMRFIPSDAGQEALRDNKAANDTPPVEFVITLPARATSATGSATVTFDGFVTALGGNLPGDSDSPADYNATIKVTGATTYSEDS